MYQCVTVIKPEKQREVSDTTEGVYVVLLRTLSLVCRSSGETAWSDTTECVYVVS